MEVAEHADHGQCPRPLTDEEQARLFAAMAEKAWFMAGLTLRSGLKDACVGEPPVWILPPTEVPGLGTPLDLDVKVVEDVTPHLAFDLA